MKTLTIDRSKWRTGGNNEHQTGRGETLLLNEFGHMCCLGFYCLQSGIYENRLKGAAAPYNLDYVLKDNDVDMRLVLSGFEDEDGDYILENTKFTDEAIAINDKQDIDSETREHQITEHFARFGVEVVFVGEYESKEVINAFIEKYGIVEKAMVN